MGQAEPVWFSGEQEEQNGDTNTSHSFNAPVWLCGHDTGETKPLLTESQGQEEMLERTTATSLATGLHTWDH